MLLGVDDMRETYQRAVDLAQYIVKTGSTVRAAAKVFKISKSTVHKDISFRLKRIDPILYREVNEIMLKNKSERHIRGGNATRVKYELFRALKKERPER